jgi:hypothetical protein
MCQKTISTSLPQALGAKRHKPGVPSIAICHLARGLALHSFTMHNEYLLIAKFVKRNKRDRYRKFLSNPQLRHKFTGQLAHLKDFDPKYRLPFPSDKLRTGSIALELQKRHSPNIVFVISEDSTLDQKELPLIEALERIVGRGMGTVLSCIPGRLAFVETEDERFILERLDPLVRREYIRFVVGHKDEESHFDRGILNATAQALEWQGIKGADADELNELLAWFGNNLERPTSFGRDSLRRGICWFKTGSIEHISRIWEMVRILERNGIYVKKVSSSRPGYIIYEDEWQLVAEPFRKNTM